MPTFSSQKLTVLIKLTISDELKRIVETAFFWPTCDVSEARG